jgi:hypothetical protein
METMSIVCVRTILATAFVCAQKQGVLGHEITRCKNLMDSHRFGNWIVFIPVCVCAQPSASSTAFVHLSA